MSAPRPIFLVGCPRSGTTLLSVMLHAHPRIAMPPETRFLLPVYRNRAAYGDLTVEENRRRLARRITEPKRSRFADLGLNRRRVVEAIVAAPPTIGSATATVWREFAHSRGKPRWGEKRPAYWADIDVIMMLYPTAQIVHLVRDGRACVASLTQVDWWHTGALGAMATWSLAERELRKAGRRLPADGYHRLRYEDLLTDPRGQLEDLCRFLGEDFDDAMLDYAPAADDIVPGRKSWHDRTRGDLDTGRITAWQDVLDADDVGLFEQVAGLALRANGYELSGIGNRPSLPAVVGYHRLCAHRIAGMSRVRVLDSVQRRRERTLLADQV